MDGRANPLMDRKVVGVVFLAHRCGAKHISKSKCTKNTRFGPLWTFRARFAWQAQEIVHLVKSEQNVRVLSHFQLQPPLHHTTLHYNYNYNYTFTTFHYITLRYTTLHYTTLQSCVRKMVRDKVV